MNSLRNRSLAPVIWQCFVQNWDKNFEYRLLFTVAGVTLSSSNKNGAIRPCELITTQNVTCLSQSPSSDRYDFQKI